MAPKSRLHCAVEARSKPSRRPRHASTARWRRDQPYLNAHVTPPLRGGGAVKAILTPKSRLHCAVEAWSKPSWHSRRVFIARWRRGQSHLGAHVTPPGAVEARSKPSWRPRRASTARWRRGRSHLGAHVTPPLRGGSTVKAIATPKSRLHCAVEARPKPSWRPRHSSTKRWRRGQNHRGAQVTPPLRGGGAAEAILTPTSRLHCAVEARSKPS